MNMKFIQLIILNNGNFVSRIYTRTESLNASNIFFSSIFRSYRQLKFHAHL